jgi:protein FAM32A
MGNDEYASAVGGGLKLKGGPLAGIKKKKKKSSKEKEKLSTNLERALSPSKPSPASGAADSPDAPSEAPAKPLTDEEQIADLEERIAKAEREAEGGEDYKTPAERQQEEMRRKRLEERLRREGGPKTHKQRVEELNRYLSGLSEHHDMPRIGPG